MPLALVTALFFVAVKDYGTPNAMPFADVATAMMGGTVFPMMYSAIFLLRMDGLYGKMYVLLPFCVAFLGDSFAMYGGMLFGKRKMGPGGQPPQDVGGFCRRIDRQRLGTGALGCGGPDVAGLRAELPESGPGRSGDQRHRPAGRSRPCPSSSGRRA